MDTSFGGGKGDLSDGSHKRMLVFLDVCHQQLHALQLQLVCHQGGGLRSSSAFRSFMVLLSFYRSIDQLLNQSHKLFRLQIQVDVLCQQDETRGSCNHPQLRSLTDN
ncbi:hypothetical protein OPV22_004689 [Ensete ventricosum]|uniref:Uncharacterized protein n=1 Tax=Ensete ventricosum TaxID=4639 RepID=A0AAV8RPG8_ENSVE|nr:hypothetical protein OPV22_004689 [Ensete ventricosum]